MVRKLFFRIVLMLAASLMGAPAWLPAQETIDGIVGVVLNGKTGMPGRVAAVLPKSPAQQAGIQVGDLILSVNGQDVDKAGLTYVQIAKLLRGTEGTEVKLAVLDVKSKQLHKRTLTRVHPSKILGRPQAVAPKTAEAAVRLARVSVFAIGPAGTGAQASKGEEDFRRVLADPLAYKVFTDLLQSGSPAAQLYALLGLKKIAPKAFEEKVKPYLTSSRSVRAMQGGTVGETPMATLARNIQAGNYDVALSAQ